MGSSLGFAYPLLVPRSPWYRLQLQLLHVPLLLQRKLRNPLFNCQYPALQIPQPGRPLNLCLRVRAHFHTTAVLLLLRMCAE